MHLLPTILWPGLDKRFIEDNCANASMIHCWNFEIRFSLQAQGLLELASLVANREHERCFGYGVPDQGVQTT